MTLDDRMKKIQASLRYAGLTALSNYMQVLREEHFIERVKERRILNQCLEERSHFVRVINEAIKIANMGDEQIAELKTKNEEWEASFKLYDDAMRRGIKIWQKTTGKTEVWPDAAKLITWLMEQLDQTRDERDKLLGLFGDYEFSPTVEQCREIWNRVIKGYHQLQKILQESYDENLQLEERLAEQDTLLDKINILTKRIEIKIDNAKRNTDLLIEEKEKVQAENAILRHEKELLWVIRNAQANMIGKLHRFKLFALREFPILASYREKENEEV